MILTVIFLSFSSFAQTKYCSTEASFSHEKKILAPDGVSYFLRPSGKTKEVGFATLSGKNMIMNVQTGQSTNVAGIIDPVPSPDGVLLAVPGDVVYLGADATPKSPESISEEQLEKIEYRYTGSTQIVEKRRPNTLNWQPTTLTLSALKAQKATYLASGMSFYTKDKSNPKAYNLTAFDATVSENYQSLGVVKNVKETRYRMLYEGSKSIMLKEYTWNPSNQKLTPLGDAKPMCNTNTGINSALPMLSKDGTEFSTYDPQSQSTKVYSIATCAVVAEIPSLVGKIDFSPNGRFLAFHVDGGNKIGTNQFRLPKDDGTNLSLFLYDRKNKKLIPLKSQKRTDLYYPVFLSDDEIAYVSKNKDNEQFYITSAQLEFSNLDNCGAAPKGKSETSKGVQ
ncbi:hypothetical protein [Bdellovibrio svalbardensis]|uniref:Translocation protein TolB n=1 Tax=Bdellovibrio svalbardensis TaxID=2972972 RepID=A0ABT6DIZ0_9BACT|nr:hypothetical protein [Bdellovibrio svalbardensis]MDG0816807.1 hypothetical protein [Bdellovibrio svalbardensis]